MCCRFDEDIEQAKTAAREASLVAKRAQQALAQSVAGCGGSYRGPLAFFAPAGCRIPATTTRERRLLQGHRRVHGVCTAGSLLLSVGDPRWWKRPTPSSRQRGRRRGKRTSSMEAAWARVDCTPYARQTRAAPTLALVKALLIAHDEDPDPVFWPDPGGRVGRTKPGKMSRQSRPRGPQPWGWRQKWWGWRPPPPPRG